MWTRLVEFTSFLAVANAFTPNTAFRHPPLAQNGGNGFSENSFLRSTAENLSAFADSLEEEDEAALFENDEDEELQTWQESLEMLLDVNTPASKRTILLSDLVSGGNTTEF